MEMLLPDVENSCWIDSLGFQVNLRKKAIHEVNEYLKHNINGDNLPENEIMIGIFNNIDGHYCEVNNDISMEMAQHIRNNLVLVMMILNISQFLYFHIFDQPWVRNLFYTFFFFLDIFQPKLTFHYMKVLGNRYAMPS